MKDGKEYLNINRKAAKDAKNSEMRSLGGVKKERQKDFEVGGIDRFRYRTRYFTDGGIIGTKAFVERIYQDFKHHFTSKHEKRPKGIKGLAGVYSLKQLTENI